MTPQARANTFHLARPLTLTWTWTLTATATATMTALFLDLRATPVSVAVAVAVAVNVRVNAQVHVNVNVNVNLDVNVAVDWDVDVAVDWDVDVAVDWDVNVNLDLDVNDRSGERYGPCVRGAMRILGVGDSCDLGDMYLRLIAEGHELRVFTRELEEHGTMRGMLPHVRDYRAELDWVRAAGDQGLVLFESAEHGAEQDALRRDGFYVIGGSAFGDRLENDRAFGQAALGAADLRAIPTHEFDDFERAMAFVRQRPRRYVFKLNGSATSSWRNFVGQAEDGRDMLALLGSQRVRLERVGLARPSFILMDYVDGVETGIGAYFDGQSFLSPACLDWEHKRLFAGDVGELTGEMGTLVTYRDSERLFSQTLARLAPQLREGGYVGYINLNTIINEQGIWPLELTCRFGYPGYAILDALQSDGWSSLFHTLRARGGQFATRAGYAVGVVLSVPPYPYRYGYADISRGLPIVYAPTLSPEEHAHLHFGEVDQQDGQLVTSGVIGYTLVATGVGDSVARAQERAYAVAAKVYVPNVRYRIDIGDAFRDRGHARLRAWGYLP